MGVSEQFWFMARAESSLFILYSLSYILSPTHFPCLMVNTWSPTEIFPFRETPVAFGAIVKVIAVVPIPRVAELMLTQLGLLVALHPHAGPVTTLNHPSPPVDEIAKVAGASKNEHPESLL